MRQQIHIGHFTNKLFFFGLLILSSCVKDNTKNGQLTLELGDTINQLVLQTQGKHISGLRLQIKGEIQGTGQLSFGDSDSTSYRTYDLKEGKIELEYEGDWYSEFCYLTYKPTTETKGQLTVEGDFFGD